MSVAMNSIHHILEVMLVFFLWSEDAMISFETAAMSLLEFAPKGPSHHVAVQRLHSRIDRKMHTHRRQATSSASALRMLRAPSNRMHPNMWRQMKVH